MDSDQIFALAGLLFFCCNGDFPATPALRGSLPGGGIMTCLILAFSNSVY